MENPPTKNKLYQSFNYAVEGLVHVFKTQRNLRFHFLIAILVLFSSFLFHIERSEIILLSLTISLVLISEIFNTAVESIANLINQNYHPLIRTIKDICAGAVFISAINALVVGYLVFSPMFSRGGITFNDILSRIKQAPSHLVFITLTLVISLVVVSKVYLGRGTPGRGGIPSGHSAFVFSLWMLITFMAKNFLVSSLSLILAFLVVRSRVKAGIHNVVEVVVGALLGIVITFLVFWLLR